MRKCDNILIPLMMASLCVSCVTRKEPVVYSSDPEAIKIDARIKVDFTKSNPMPDAGDPMSFNIGDKMFVSSEDGTITYEFRKGAWSPTDNYYFRWGSEGLPFHSSYPATTGSDWKNFTLPSNQSTVDKIAAADYMTCDIDAIHNDGTGVLHLDMERRMSKVIYTVNSIADDEVVKGFKINSPAAILSGISSDETIMVTPFVVVPDGGARGGNGTQYVALVIPSAERYSEDQVTLVYKNAPMSFKVIPAREAGKKYEYQVKVEGDAISISDPAVSDWTEAMIPDGTAYPNRCFHWFVKPDGTGDGTSWENAMGLSTLREMLATTGSDKERAALYDKTQFHFAGGSYVLADQEGHAFKIEYSGYHSQVSISWDGGYNPASIGTSLSDRNTTAYETIFHGNDQFPILQLGNQTSMTFNGITFSNASSSGKGAAIFQAPGSSGSSTVVASECKFLSNKGSAGGSICSVKGDMTITGCFFEKNEAVGNGGAISFAGTNLTLGSCLFHNNVSGNSAHTVSNTSDGKGGALWLSSSTGSTVSINHCEFSANRAGITDDTDSKEYGGAIAIGSAEVTATLCEFSANKGNRGSAVMMCGSGLFKADRCSFHGNFQYSRGVILVLSKNVVMLNQCSFFGQENRSASGSWGVAVHASSNTAVCANNCSFRSTKTYGKQVAGLNTDGYILVTNSTVIGHYHDDQAACIRGGSLYLANNVIANSNPSGVSLNGNPDYIKFNAIGSTNVTSLDEKNEVSNNFVGIDPNLFTWTEWQGNGYDLYKSCFIWNGTLDNYTRAKESDVTSAYIYSDLDISSWGGQMENLKNLGESFKSWLEEMTPAGYTLNQHGEVRSAEYWPGSYQN